MQIIEDFLTEDLYQNLLREINGSHFPWFYQDYSSYVGDNVSQFTHTFYTEDKVNSQLFDLVIPLINTFQLKTNYVIDEFKRAKANMLLNTPYKEDDLKNAIHQDKMYEGYISLLYYLEDSDGDTILYDKDKKTELIRVSPKANRSFIFKSDEWHNATPPKLHATRKVINLIFKIKKGAQI